MRAIVVPQNRGVPPLRIRRRGARFRNRDAFSCKYDSPLLEEAIGRTHRRRTGRRGRTASDVRVVFGFSRERTVRERASEISRDLRARLRGNDKISRGDKKRKYGNECNARKTK